jgi:enterochelin esterase-like enzyme
MLHVRIALFCPAGPNRQEPNISVPFELQMRTIITVFLFLSGTVFADGTLTPDTRITSEVLGYDLQYRVYVPENTESGTDFAVLFVTDGPGYISNGHMPLVLDKLIGDGEISPVIVVFVDSRDPDNLRNNRRNAEFLCNGDYLDFYVQELIPAIEQHYPVGRSRAERGILGLSFGATNAACFGLLGHETFSLIGMHSPANHPVRELLPAYEKMPRLPLNMFLSTGTPDDNTADNRRFHRVLEEKGYSVKYIEVRQGHNWKNWKPLIDDVLLYFYGTEQAVMQ